MCGWSLWITQWITRTHTVNRTVDGGEDKKMLKLIIGKFRVVAWERPVRRDRLGLHISFKPNPSAKAVAKAVLSVHFGCIVQVLCVTLLTSWQLAMASVCPPLRFYISRFRTIQDCLKSELTQTPLTVN